MHRSLAGCGNAANKGAQGETYTVQLEALVVASSFTYTSSPVCKRTTIHRYVAQKKEETSV
jgi:hypothetical protein